MSAQQPEALRLADALDVVWAGGIAPEADAELRRLHAENLLLHERHAGDNQILRSIETQRDELLEALEKIIEMNRVTARDQFGDSEQAERWACVIVARAAIAKAGGAA